MKSVLRVNRIILNSGFGDELINMLLFTFWSPISLLAYFGCPKYSTYFSSLPFFLMLHFFFFFFFFFAFLFIFCFVFKGKACFWHSHCGSVEVNLTNIHEDIDLLLGLAQWVKDPALP